MSRTLALALVSVIFFVGCQEKEKTVVEKKEVLVRLGQADFDPAAIYKRVAPSVATVLPASGGQSVGQGSGFLLAGGIVVTNAHVVLSEGGEPYREVYLQWQSGDRSRAQVLRVDPDRDLALLRTRPPRGLRSLSLSPRSRFIPGEPVAAIGSPFGESQSLSTGIISAVERSVRSLTDFQISDAIQTDASINPGNSGGPLLDSAGDVIGINQQIRTSSGGNSGVGYAISVRDLRRLLTALKQDKEIRDAYLGISTQEVWPQLASRLRIPKDSLLVSSVVPNGPADRSDIRSGTKEIFFQGSPVVTGGDIVLAIDNKRVKDSGDLSDALRNLQPGDRVVIGIWRNGKKRMAEVILGERPE